MGFSTIVSQTIFISIMMVVMVSSIFIFSSYIYKTHNSLQEKYTAMDLKSHTELTIMNITYDQVTDEIAARVKNTGRSAISLRALDIYVDSMHIGRNAANRTIVIDPATEIRNPGIWDPEEEVDIDIRITLAGGMHYVELFSDNSVSDIMAFRVFG
jgi:archaellum component FlaF (FlaF/FlaG flagellin family)